MNEQLEPEEEETALTDSNMFLFNIKAVTASKNGLSVDVTVDGHSSNGITLQ